MSTERHTEAMPPVNSGSTSKSKDDAHAEGSKPSFGAKGKKPAPTAAEMAGPRRVRLTLSRVDPWSVMKLSFLLAVAVGIALVVATALLWSVVDGIGVFDQLNSMVKEIAGGETDVDILQYLEFSKVISLATVVAVLNVVLITALATLGAFLYNIAAALLGGLHMTLTDD